MVSSTYSISLSPSALSDLFFNHSHAHLEAAQRNNFFSGESGDHETAIRKDAQEFIELLGGESTGLSSELLAKDFERRL